jgi:hypothetical protein
MSVFHNVSFQAGDVGPTARSETKRPQDRASCPSECRNIPSERAARCIVASKGLEALREGLALLLWALVGAMPVAPK